MRDNKKYLYIIIILLTVATFAAFVRIGGNDFLNFDDEGYVTENNHIKSGINSESIPWAFRTVVLSNWVPLAMLSHMVDWTLFGPNAGGHHIVSLLLHIGAVIFLFLFLNKATNNIWTSAFAAAFFALHPLRVESVAWASERRDVLSMFFGMATLWAYAFYAKKPRLSSYFTCLLLFILSLLSKSMLITLPFVLLLLDYWPLGRWQKEITNSPKNIIFNRLIGEKIPFLLLTFIFSIITFLVQYEANSVYPPGRIFNAVVAYVAYLGKTLWPVDLTLKYFYLYSFPVWQITFSCLILIIITILAIYYIRSRPYLFVGWFWYLGTLVPVIGFIPTSALLADHYTYFPSIGISIMLAWGIPSIISRQGATRQILFPAAITVLAILIVLTWNQCGYWKNSVDFWNHAVKIIKDNPHAYLRLGHAYDKLGDNQRVIYNFDKVIHLKPDDHTAYNGRGIIYFRLGQYQKAMDNFNNAIRLKPDYADAYHNRALIYLYQKNERLGCEDARKACSLGICDTMEAAKEKGYCR